MRIAPKRDGLCAHSKRDNILLFEASGYRN